ncbi:MAG: CRTAC1 family protein [Bacteroidota bacterium]
MPQSSSKPIIFLALLLVLAFGGYQLWQNFQWQVENNQSPQRYFTEEEIRPDWLEQRAQEQIEQAKSYQTFHDFSFSDQLPASGITFQHYCNPDGAKDHKPVHYDHGNGLCIADVDGDGRTDIYLVSQVGAGGLWRNLGDGKFADITPGSGLEITAERTSVSASFGDIDNDGDPDLYVSTIRDGNFLFENDGTGKFKDISVDAKVDYHGHSSGITFVDYNKDGLLDIFVTNVGIYTNGEKTSFDLNGQTYDYYVGFKDGFAGHMKPERSESSIFYENLGDNQFKEVSKQLGIDDIGWTGDANIIDANDDGYPDLYITNMQGHDQYYENDKGKGFIDKGRELFPKTSWGAMSVVAFDFDNNGFQDIYVTDMHSDMGANSALGINMEKAKVPTKAPENYLMTNGMSIFGNSFFRKDGTNQYTEVSDTINAENYWPWGLSSGDLNADGFTDVFIASSMNYPFRYAVNSVLLNENGQRFVDSEFVLGVEPRRGGEFAKPWFELDCSGADKEHRHCVGQEGKRTIYGALGSRSSALFDLDEDGDLDIVTNEFNGAPMVLISNLSDKVSSLSFLKVQLQGSQSNRDGLGAKVIVEAAGQTYTRIHDGKSGYLAQSSYPLYFGLNGAEKVDKVAVRWPSGQEQIIDSPTIINGLLLIEEPQS